jgi:hypothetical protein
VQVHLAVQVHLQQGYFFQTRGHRGKQGRDPDCGLGVVMNSGFGFGRDWDF